MNTIKKLLTAILLLTICASLSACVRDTEESLTTFGKKQFIENDLEQCVENLRGCGLDDLTANIKITNKYYDEKSNRLTLFCELTDITSNRIDDYYTTDYNSSEAENLAAMLYSLWLAYRTNRYIYETNSGGIVEVELSRPVCRLYVSTTAGREYEYWYYDWTEVRIDGECVYNKGEYSSSSSSTTSSYVSREYTVTDDKELGACWALAKMVVKSYLKSPSTAKFPFSYGSEGVSITKSGSTYTVKAWVDAENSFGAMLRSNFTVTMLKSGSGSDIKYTFESCDIE